MNWVATDSSGRGLLHFAAQYGMPRVAEVVLSKGCAVDAQDANQCTPLHYAVFNGERDVVEFLLRYNAKVTILDCNNETPIQLAQAIPDRDDILPLLLDAQTRQANGAMQQPFGMGYGQQNEMQSPEPRVRAVSIWRTVSKPGDVSGSPQQPGTISPTGTPDSPFNGQQSPPPHQMQQQQQQQQQQQPLQPLQPGTPTQPQPLAGSPSSLANSGNINNASAGNGNSGFGNTAFTTATPIPQAQRANLTSSGGSGSPSGGGSPGTTTKRDRGLSGLINSVKKAFGSTSCRR
jgi:ankyrin repeat protein